MQTSPMMPIRVLDRENKERAKREAQARSEQLAREQFASGVKHGTEEDPDIPANIPRYKASFVEAADPRELRDSVQAAYEVFLSRYPDAEEYDPEPIIAYGGKNLINVSTLAGWEWSYARCHNLGMLQKKIVKEKRNLLYRDHDGKFLPFGVRPTPRVDPERIHIDLHSGNGVGWELDANGMPTGEKREYSRYEIEAMPSGRYKKAFRGAVK